ncbi:histidine kinase [Intrasporangium oryzae NRRL B-24470]|uniref:histidine kinase n=1 Tax=Intrasporangium oryzae NRRL B-24470 TaxID=1386089 RepID=W9GB30_9MICO|nr:histidine kinase [Intrasporangium oryzae]EWT01054.1 histidine kinase [Intrasporangium oryzae NRRL B-24470]
MTIRGRSIAMTLTCVALLAIPPVVGARAGHLAEGARGLPQTAAFLAAGALALLSQPRHRGARRLFGTGVVMAVGYVVGSAYSAHRLDGGAPAWQPVIVLQALEIGQALTLLGLLAVFPDGHYRSDADRTAVRALAAVAAAVVLAARFGATRPTYPGSFIWGDRVSAVNPTVQPGLAWLGPVAEIAYQASFPVCLLAGLLLLVLRFRGSEPAQRRQIRWLAFGALVTVVTGVTLGALGPWVQTLPTWLVYVLYAPAALALPMCLGLGMVRDNVLDIDAAIRRSMAYAVLWVLVGALCVGAALGLGVLAGTTLPLPAAIGLTVAASLLLAPLRGRLERLADRVVHGRRLSGYELITRLGDRLEAAPTPDQVAPEVAGDVRVGIEASWVRVVVDPDADRDVDPDAGSHLGGQVVGAAGPVPEAAAPALRVPLVRGGATIGAIECGPKIEGRYSTSDVQLLTSLGQQAALAIHNGWLAGQLQARVDELAASRARLVAAEEAGRRRLERDLHDGVQQDLVALLARVGLVRNQIRRDSALAEASLLEVARDGQRALLAVQEVSRGLHPPLLSDRGLVEAVRERASRMPIPVDVRSGLNGSGRLQRDVEHAAYFAIAEAMTNVVKHSGASSAVVNIERSDAALRIDITDDGHGFDTERVGLRGLLGLTDRIEALGGRLTVTSAPGSGASLSFTIPEGTPS